MFICVSVHASSVPLSRFLSPSLSRSLFLFSSLSLPVPVAQLLAAPVIHGSDRCLVQLDLSLIIPKAWTALSFTIAQIISVLTAEPSVTAP